MNYRKFEIHISKKLNTFAKNFSQKNPLYNTILKKYSNKKIHLIGIRFFAPLYDKGITETEHLIPLSITLELCMQQAYITNIILDEKKDAWKSRGTIKDLIIEKDLTLMLMRELIETASITEKEKVFFAKTIFSILDKITLGFISEENIKYQRKIFDTDYEMNYKKRNTLLNRVYDYSLLLGYYFISGENLIEKYKRYIKIPFSYAGQIINDLSDFSSLYDKNVKVYQDNFSDIKNKIVTYPMYRLHTQGENISVYFEKNFDSDIFAKLYAMIKSHHIVNDVIVIAKKSYEENINFLKRHLHLNEKSLSAKSFRLLLDNKYYRSF